MVIFIDTDVLIDYICRRKPFYDNAIKIIDLRINEIFRGCISTQSIANIYYILRKELTSIERKRVLRSLCELFSPCDITREMTLLALEDTSFSDFEDCVQMHCAINANADLIITRNTKDYANSRIKAVTPDEFLELVS
jgi:predicted nucleic acid-binding protein